MAQKSVRIMLSLLKNAASNAEAKRLDVEKVVVKRVVVNQAMRGRRRTFRAHGRINAFMSSPCHVELFCEEVKERVKKEKVNAKEEIPRIRNVKQHIRKAVAKNLRNKKFVEIGGKK